jgi:hypothetical protein
MPNVIKRFSSLPSDINKFESQGEEEEVRDIHSKPISVHGKI